MWQKCQQAEAQLDAFQAQIDSLTQALTLASKRKEPTPAPPGVEKEVQTTLVFTLSQVQLQTSCFNMNFVMMFLSFLQDGELLSKEREKADAEIKMQMTKAKEELEQLRVRVMRERDNK